MLSFSKIDSIRLIQGGIIEKTYKIEAKGSHRINF